MLELLWQRSEFGGQNIQGRRHVTVDLLQKARETTIDPVSLEVLEDNVFIQALRNALVSQREAVISGTSMVAVFVGQGWWQDMVL